MRYDSAKQASFRSSMPLRYKQETNCNVPKIQLFSVSVKYIIQHWVHEKGTMKNMAHAEKSTNAGKELNTCTHRTSLPCPSSSWSINISYLSQTFTQKLQNVLNETHLHQCLLRYITMQIAS